MSRRRKSSAGHQFDNGVPASDSARQQEADTMPKTEEPEDKTLEERFPGVFSADESATTSAEPEQAPPPAPEPAKATPASVVPKSEDEEDEEEIARRAMEWIKRGEEIGKDGVVAPDYKSAPDVYTVNRGNHAIWKRCNGKATVLTREQVVALGFNPIRCVELGWITARKNN